MNSVSCVPNEGENIQTEGEDEERSEEEDEESSEGEDEEPSPPPPEPQQKVETALRVCRYLAKMFSVPLLRSHATVSLVDRDRLQLYHANRSVILISSAINFLTDDGKDKLIATTIAFHRLSLDQNGTLASVIPKNVDLLPNTDLSGKVRVVQRGNKLHFSGNEHGVFKIELANVISREEGMVGRSTLVLHAKSTEWETPIVIKIGWPTSDQVSETDFLTKASAMAKGEYEWAAKHIPKVYYAEDVVFDSHSTLESVASLFENTEFASENYVYERRTLRIIIQERLYPLNSLTSVKEFGQVFLDVLCSTCSYPVFLFDYHQLTSVQFTVGFTTILGSCTATSALTTSCTAWSR